MRVHGGDLPFSVSAFTISRLASPYCSDVLRGNEDKFMDVVIDGGDLPFSVSAFMISRLA